MDALYSGLVWLRFFSLRGGAILSDGLHLSGRVLVTVAGRGLYYQYLFVLKDDGAVYLLSGSSVQLYHIYTRMQQIKFSNYDVSRETLFCPARGK